MTSWSDVMSHSSSGVSRATIGRTFPFELVRLNAPMTLASVGPSTNSDVSPPQPNRTTSDTSRGNRRTPPPREKKDVIRCERGDSNPQAFRRQILSLVRLPVSPLSPSGVKLTIGTAPRKAPQRFGRDDQNA